MLQGLVSGLHPRWRRFLEISVYRPVRGSIDLVLDDLDGSTAIAAEAHSQLRRLEQQVRWSGIKADALRSGGSPELATVLAERTQVSRLLIVRVTRANVAVVATFSELLAAAYPARHADAVESLTGTRTWPGAALLWMDVSRGMARLRSVPPRGIALGR